MEPPLTVGGGRRHSGDFFRRCSDAVYRISAPAGMLGRAGSRPGLRARSATGACLRRRPSPATPNGSDTGASRPGVRVAAWVLAPRAPRVRLDHRPVRSSARATPRLGSGTMASRPGRLVLHRRPLEVARGGAILQWPCDVLFSANHVTEIVGTGKPEEAVGRGQRREGMVSSRSRNSRCAGRMRSRAASRLNQAQRSTSGKVSCRPDPRGHSIVV